MLWNRVPTVERIRMNALELSLQCHQDRREEEAVIKTAKHFEYYLKTGKSIILKERE